MNIRSTTIASMVWVILIILVPISHADDSVFGEIDAPELFVNLLDNDSTGIAESIEILEENWHPGMIPMTLETIRFAQSGFLFKSLIAMLSKQTGQQLGNDLDDWYQWLWAQDEIRHPNYAQFKSLLYREIDSRFANYFDDSRQTTIRLDEARWGGVQQDGIPPLRQPEMITASEATYLSDTDVIFGIEYNGDARAYPKRILAWHEMFVDTVGGEEYAGVYCTLCGAVILYKTHHEGVRHELGTSGFLYRSNKMMYDKATQSLWSTTWGKPTVGPLVGKGIELERSYVVTSTWGEWKRRHPDTKVLSLNTGHNRNYAEGFAYRQYFATDELMFTVPSLDDRLANKAEILALQFPGVTDDRLAISADYLSDKPIYTDRLGAQAFVVFTDLSGANRVYESFDIEFVSYDGDNKINDSEGRSWTLTESHITRDDGKTHARLPAHRAFWFGWQAAHQDTRLVM